MLTLSEEQFAAIQGRIKSSARVVRPLEKPELPVPEKLIEQAGLTKQLTVTLPWPPSVNSYWRHPTSGKLAGRHLISREGRLYRGKVKEIVWDQKQVIGKVAVYIEACPPDNRRRDLDNILKSLLDCLVHAALIQDDSYIDDLHIVRKKLDQPGQVVVRITAVSQEFKCAE